MVADGTGVYISYAWGKTGDEKEEIVNQLDRALQERGIKIIRDKRDLGYRGSITKFMEQIGRGVCVIVVVSDKYLRSPNCMFELVEIAENKQFHERIFPIVLADADIYDPVKRIAYIKHWETKRDELAAEIKTLDPANLHGIREDIDNYDRFRDKISGLTSILKDMNTLTPEIHRESNFETLYTDIEKRLREFAEEKASALDSTSKALAPTWPKDKSPFPGLRAFGPDDAPIFFGREAETEILVRRLSDPNCRFLVVVGESGSGKSSLVGAGLLSRLKENALPGSKDWSVVTFKPDVNPITALTTALEQSAFQLEASQRRSLGVNDGALRQLFEEYLATGPETRRVLLFIDQFEELFTRVTDENLRQHFQRLLNETANSERVLIVATIRDDFFHHCVKSPILSRLINRNTDSTFTLSAPGPVELHEMVSKPAGVAGLEFEPGLVRQILKDTGDDPGALALLAYALAQLHKEAIKGNGKLTSAAYNAFGGVKGAIGDRAEKTFKTISENARAALPMVFRELLDVDESGTATRKRAQLADVEKDEACIELVRTLEEDRLLVKDNEQGLVEVAHEALFRSWDELAAWIEKTKDAHILRRQVHTAATEWEKKGRKPEYLWPDERLKLVYEMKKNLDPKWKDHEKEFIRPEAERLLEELQNPAKDQKDPAKIHRERSKIGERLDGIGDPRPGVGLVEGILPLQAEEGKPPTFDALRSGEIRLWGDQPGHAGLPDIVWVPVNGGSLQIEAQTFTVEPFYIAKYLVTYRQFQTFIEAEDGFKDPRWWEGLSANKIDKSKPGEQYFKIDNHPRENVSWYDSIAFCRWLNARLNWPAIPASLSVNTLETFKGVRLPTEWEWQWAATGGNPGFEYPWGVEWDGTKANTSESVLGRTMAVGMYLAGSAACGALDLSGNVCEWCLNEYSKPKNNNMSDRYSPRVVRGGSWDYPRDSARASYRFHWGPGDRRPIFGFRLVVRPPGME